MHSQFVITTVLCAHVLMTTHLQRDTGNGTVIIHTPPCTQQLHDMAPSVFILLYTLNKEGPLSNLCQTSPFRHVCVNRNQDNPSSLNKGGTTGVINHDN